jgi:hypothetical protein
LQAFGIRGRDTQCQYPGHGRTKTKVMGREIAIVSQPSCSVARSSAHSTTLRTLEM